MAAGCDVEFAAAGLIAALIGWIAGGEAGGGQAGFGAFEIAREEACGLVCFDHLLHVAFVVFDRLGLHCGEAGAAREFAALVAEILRLAALGGAQAASGRGGRGVVRDDCGRGGAGGEEKGSKQEEMTNVAHGVFRLWCR